MGKLYTIGYANKDFETFLKMLQDNNVNCLVDIRTTPYSKQYPEYNEDVLKEKLKDNKITYLPFKNEFGARRQEHNVYSNITYPDGSYNDVVIFEKVWTTNEFKKGVERIKNGLNKGFNICLMCSEKHPFECHRDIMVSEYFYRYEKIEVNHIFSISEVYKHTSYDGNIKNIFEAQKNKFFDKHYKELSYSGGLFAEEYPIKKYVKEWEDFFKEYTREKGYYLQNLFIGYKKGEEDYD